MAGNRRSPIKGVQDIRTHAGKIDHQSHPHMAYMRMGCLEMEKARKEKERVSAQRRIDVINQRLAEIEREKADIQQILDDNRTGRRTCRRRDISLAPEDNGTFKISY